MFTHVRVFCGGLALFLFLFTAQSAHAATLAGVEKSVELSSTLFHMIAHQVGNDRYLIVAAGEDGVHLYKITDSGFESSPTATIDTDGTAMDVVAYSNTLYIADKNSGSGFSSKGHVLTYDISTPASPELLNDYTANLGTFQSVALSSDGNTLYAGDKLSGVHIIDVTDPENQELIEIYGDGLSAVDLQVSGTTLYLLQTFTTGEAGAIQIVDASNTDDMSLLGSIVTANDANEFVYNSSGVLSLSNGSSGLSFYDVSNPSSISLLGTQDTDGSAKAVDTVRGTFTLLADGSNGVILIRTGGGVTVIDSENSTIASAVDVVALDNAFYVLSQGIHYVPMEYAFDASGTKDGKAEKVTVTEGGSDWCTIAVSDKKVGAYAFAADVTGDGHQDIIEAPKGAIKKPKVRVYDSLGESCPLFSKKKLNDSDKKKKFVTKVGQYYGSDTSKQEIVSARTFEKDGEYKLQLIALFVNSEGKVKQKKKKSFVVKKKLVKQGITLKIKAGKSYPIVAQAKDDADKKEKFKLVKKNGEFKLKKKDS